MDSAELASFIANLFRIPEDVAQTWVRQAAMKKLHRVLWQELIRKQYRAALREFAP